MSLCAEDLIFKILTGQIVKNHKGTFYFSEPGNWIDSDGYPIQEKLHREDGPAVEGADGTKIWYVNGELHRSEFPYPWRKKNDKKIGG